MASAGCSVDMVLIAVNKLYNEPNTLEKEKASRWLHDFQRSVFAWETSDQLLQTKNDVESTYFAAQTMRSKVLYSFNELPESSHISLKDSLLNHIEQLHNMSPIILTQLALAVCDLALQMITWKNPAVTFMQTYANNKDSLVYLLELLTLLPEEVRNKSLRLGDNRRNEVMDEMENSAPMVVDLLKAYLSEESTKNDKTMSKIFKCLSSWFCLGILPGNHVARSKLLDFPFTILQDIGTSNLLYEAACDCVCAALYTAQDINRNSELISTLFHGIHKLRETFHSAVAHEDTDKCMSLCRVFSELAEILMDSIVSKPNEGLGDLKTLDLLLICNGHFQYDVAELTFPAWYRLSESLHESTNNAKTPFIPFIERLIYSIVRHCQMEPDTDKLLDENDDFYDFRLRVSELVRDVVGLVGATQCYIHLFSLLSNVKNPPTWDVTEATLFVMSAIAKNIDLEEETTTSQVLHAIISLPDDVHIILKHTSVIMLGELAKWISAHSHILDPILQFLTGALHTKELSSAAATSLQYLCLACTDSMTQHHTSLVQLISVSDHLHISNEASLGLLKGVTTVLNRLPADQCHSCVRQLVLTQSITIQKNTSSETSNQDITIPLDRLAAIFQGLRSDKNSQSHTRLICENVFKEVWPVLYEMLKYCKAENKIVERWCRCIRFAVRSCGKTESNEMLEAIGEAIANTYRCYQHSCFLYLGSVLVDVYDDNPVLLSLLNSFLEPLFKLLNENKGLENNPDTVDDLFRLCNRFIEHNPFQFLSHQACSPLLQCAIKCLRHDQREANQSVTKFLRCVITCRPPQGQNGARQKITDEVVQTFGESIVNDSLIACLFHIPSFLYPDIAEIWWQLIQRDRAMFADWLKQALNALPAGSSLATATSEQTFAFHSNIICASEWTTVSYHLRDFCRLYR